MPGSRRPTVVNALFGELSRIALDILLPVALLAGAGIAVDRTLRPDLATLSRLCFHVFLPALIFVRVIGSPLPLAVLGRLAAATGVQTLAMLLLGLLVWRGGRAREQRLVLALGASLSNGGNLGLPLAALALGDAGVSAMAVVMMAQNLLTFTAGIYAIERHRRAGLQFALGLFRTPVIWAVVLGLAGRGLGLTLPAVLAQPLGQLANGLVPAALVTLGAQLSRTSVTRGAAAVGALCAVRLVLSPLLALAMVPAFGLDGTVAAVFVVGAGLPVAVNVFILAAEYRLDAALASQAVFWSTVLSAFSVAVLLTLLL